MKIFAQLKNSLSNLFGASRGETKQIGIYGPTNSGKTTFANRVVRDWKGEEMGTIQDVPHETRRVMKEEGVTIERGNSMVEMNIVDTPGVETKIDKEELMDDHGFEEDDAVRRSREAAQGVGEAMRWLREDIDGVLYVLDSTKDPLAEVNNVLTGIIESKDIPVLILANKIDLEESDVRQIRQVYPQHEVIQMSAKEGDNMDEVYDKIADKFGR